jgi:hypothetical protein
MRGEFQTAPHKAARFPLLLLALRKSGNGPFGNPPSFPAMNSNLAPILIAMICGFLLFSCGDPPKEATAQPKAAAQETPDPSTHAALDHFLGQFRAVMSRAEFNQVVSNHQFKDGLALLPIHQVTC